jgi:uncharacterized protein (TIGR02231 family)
MKKLFITGLVCFQSMALFAIETPDTLDTKVSQVTVFLSGAQVFRTSEKLTIDKGISKVVFRDVSPQINTHSIQASAHGEFLILDVQHKIEYFRPVAQKPVVMPEWVKIEQKLIEDSLVIKNFELILIREKKKELENEKQMILKNELMTGGGHSDTLPILQSAIEYYRLKLDEIGGLLFATRVKEHLLAQHQSRMKVRVNELKSYNAHIGQPLKPKTQSNLVIVTLYTETPVTGSVTINYLITNAGWIPAYDLRADNTSDPMKITYKANVFQNSGESWDEVDLTLSTYNQNCFTTIPSLGVWRLDYYKPGTIKLQARSQNFNSRIEAESFLEDNSGYKSLSKPHFTAFEKLSTISQSFTNVEFKIKLPYSVPQDGHHILMVVNHTEVPAKYNHTLVPRLNKDAFLQAKIGDWEGLGLLPGQANIYFKQTYVGQTAIDPAVLRDTLAVSLGRDRGIFATRKKLGDKVDKIGIAGIGKRRMRTLTFELKVKNSTLANVMLDLTDQIPVSANEEIKVEIIDDGGGVLAKSTGFIKWKLNLAGKESITLRFSYTVEYDKDKPLS